jgi:NAD(P)-dependent dehydrogenase (short-subunit alcohol dehydrogenase family)
MNYAGKRVIVAGGGSELIMPLVELGAEAHVIGTEKPSISGIASFTECDLSDDASVDAAVHKIGKIVNVLFDCVGSLHLIAAVLPNMIDGSVVVTVGEFALDAPEGIAIRVAPSVEAILAD